MGFFFSKVFMLYFAELFPKMFRNLISVAVVLRTIDRSVDLQITQVYQFDMLL